MMETLNNEQLCALAQSGDIHAQNLLIENNLGFIRQQANLAAWQFGDRAGAITDDLVQEGCLGMIEAIKRFKPESGYKFLTYAVYWIRKFMLEAAGILKAADKVDSLNRSVREEDYSELIQFVTDEYVKSPEQIYIENETREEVRTALGKIGPRERTYLLYRFGFQDGEEHPVPETAEHFHLTERRAESTEKAALRNVREHLSW